jgi:hypothetical protein
METKLNYTITSEDAWASVMELYVAFEIEEESYEARATYSNGGWMEDIKVTDSKGNQLDNEDAIFELGEELLEDLDLTQNLSW